MRVFTSRSVKSAELRAMSSIDGNGVPAFELAAITWSMLGPVAGAPVDVRPVHSEAMPASCEPCAALLASPSRTITLLCSGASGASVVAEDEVAGERRRAAERRRTARPAASRRWRPRTGARSRTA